MYIPYYHADVFTEVPFSGNGLSIFLPPVELPADRMLRITQEMKQFESIFVRPRPESSLVDARVFTVEEELTFAGHPSIGAAAQLHDLYAAGRKEARWELVFPQKTLPIETTKTDYGYSCIMNQGAAVFGEPLSEDKGRPILEALGLDHDVRFPLQVVSTGLRYLLVPIKSNFTTAAIGAEGLSGLLEAVGAKFIGLVDVEGRSMRTGDNQGKVEDIATGSLAGPVGAYLVRHGVAAHGTEIGLVQGVHLGRESRLYVTVREDVHVRGGVVLLAEGRLRVG
jgi:PhzF family phenazine biosynthesis protein